jgi:hypothetical protein
MLLVDSNEIVTVAGIPTTLLLYRMKVIHCAQDEKCEIMIALLT